MSAVFGRRVTSLGSLLCKEVKNAFIEDLEEKGLRAGGAGFACFSECFGVQGVRLPVTEAYGSLDQGILDCAMLSAPELTNLNLHEVVTDITMGVPDGVFAGVVSARATKDRWTEMSDTQRKALLWNGNQMTMAST